MTGCSALRLGYANGPQLAWWWIDGYFDFNREQAPQVKQTLDKWFEWHRGSQLPGYVALLASARQQVTEPATPALVCRWQDRIREQLEPALARAILDFADVVPGIGDAQLKHLEQKYAKLNDDMRGDFLQGDAAERQRESVKRAVERAERVYGSLDDAQLRVISAGVVASPCSDCASVGVPSSSGLLSRVTSRSFRFVVPGSCRRGPGQPGSAIAEDLQHALAEGEVVDADHGDHEQDEHQHDSGVGQQLAAGRPDDLAQLGDDLREQLSRYIKDPIVSVIVDNFSGTYSQQVRVVGATEKPASIPFRANMTLLDAMIAVGGLSEYAAGDKARLVRFDRGTGKQTEYALRIGRLLKQGDSNANVRLQPGDVIIIPTSAF